MPVKKRTNKKGGFSLVPITLSEPVKTTDGFTNLIEDVPPEVTETAAVEMKETAARVENGKKAVAKSPRENVVSAKILPHIKDTNTLTVNAPADDTNSQPQEDSDKLGELPGGEERLTEEELLRLLGVDRFEEIYELSDVLRASSLKLYAALLGLADERGRVRVKNHELMSESGIKGIATLYKQERWLTELKLVEKKAKPGPHDGSSYFVYKLETLPLPAEIYEKFDAYLSGLK